MPVCAAASGVSRLFLCLGVHTVERRIRGGVREAAGIFGELKAAVLT